MRTFKTAKMMLVLIFSMMLALGVLTACGGEEKITGAEDLAAANKEAQQKVESFHTDTDIDMEMKLNMEELKAVLGTSELSVPLQMEMNIDTGKETGHGNMSMNMSMMGQSTSQKAEMYIDMKNGVSYTKAEGAGSWTKSEQNADLTSMVPGLESLGEDILKKAEFSEEEDAYVLTVQAADMGDLITESGLLENMDLASMELKDLKLTGGKVTYKFDKEKVLLQKSEMDDVIITASGATQGVQFDVDIKMDSDIEFSRYDELKPEEYEIPDEVISGGGKGTEPAATETQAPTTETPAADNPDSQETLPPAETQLILDGDHTPNDQGWYTVGKDTPAGDYKLFHGDGQGVLWIKGVGDDDESRKWTIGYSTNDQLKDGTQVTLKNEEIVIITDGLQVVFDPVR